MKRRRKRKSFEDSTSWRKEKITIQDQGKDLYIPLCLFMSISIDSHILIKSIYIECYELKSKYRIIFQDFDQVDKATFEFFELWFTY